MAHYFTQYVFGQSNLPFLKVLHTKVLFLGWISIECDDQPEI